MDRWGVKCLTVTKHLQDQYKDLFKSSSLLKGKSSYICDIDESFTVDIAPCTSSWKIGEQCIANNICGYYNDLKANLTNNLSVLNYSKYLTMQSFIRRPQFLICDEASEVEDTLVSHFSLDISYKTLTYNKINYNTKILQDDMKTNMLWLSALKDELDTMLPVLVSKATSKTLTLSEKKECARKISFYKTLKEKIALVIASNKICKYVCQFDSESCVFTPLYVDGLAKALWSDSKHVILMSGTIFDHKTFTRILGIDKYKYIEIESDFDSNASPVYIPAKHIINYKTQDKVLPYIIAQACEIADDFKDQKGIVHTHTNKITAEFEKRTKKSKRYLYRKNNTTNESILLDHVCTDEPTVLVSPSMALGVDLPDDLSRFQIILKLPYLSLADKRVKHLFDKDKKWYTMKMFTRLIQMCGRSSRSATDYSSTYILDGAAISAIKRDWDNLPKYFKDRLKAIMWFCLFLLPDTSIVSLFV